MKKRVIKRSTPCRKERISTPFGSFILALPYSIGQRFTIGNITFENNGSGYKADKPIPESWTINL